MKCCKRIFLAMNIELRSHSTEIPVVETSKEIKGQFHQRAYAQLLRQQIPKVEKDSQVISRKKVYQHVVLLYFSGFVLYNVCSSLMKLTPG